MQTALAAPDLPAQVAVVPHTEAVSQAVAPRATLSLVATASDTVAELFDAVADMTRMMMVLEAMRAQAVDAAIQASVHTVTDASTTGSRDLRLRSLRAELACVLRIPERTAERMLHTSETLVRALPDTLSSLGSGAISYRHAETLVDEVATLEPDAVAALEAAALPHAETLTVAKFRRKLRMLRELEAPGSAIDRHHAAVTRREVLFEPARDGMAWLSAYLPAADALGAYNRLTDIADSLRTEQEERTLAQLRADAFAGLLHSGEVPDGASGIRPTVNVTVPVLRLLDSHAPASVSAGGATLEGYGPIDDETARVLAAKAPSFKRLLTHPESGAVLSVGRGSYAVPADLKRWLRLRDGTCRFPCCSQPAQRCDVDHTRDWAHGGGTDHDNLAHLCRSHHTLKHKAGWRVANDGATLEWTSPLGRSYVTKPEIMLRT